MTYLGRDVVVCATPFSGSLAFLCLLDVAAEKAGALPSLALDALQGRVRYIGILCPSRHIAL